MAKPTKAQVEAAAKAINAYEKSQGTLLYDDDWFLGHAKAALTAAAEVGEQKDWRGMYLRDTTMLTDKILAERERCAQVAEAERDRSKNLLDDKNTGLSLIARGQYSASQRIAAAIRAKKDEQ